MCKCAALVCCDITVHFLILFLLMYKVPPIDSSSTDGIEIDQSSFKGNINFNNIEFIYPSRPDVKVKCVILKSFV